MENYKITLVEKGKIRTVQVTGKNQLYSKVSDCLNSGTIIIEVRTEKGRLVCL